MSKIGGGGRVNIPKKWKKTVENIKEITIYHTEDEIYAVLIECNFEPHEATQRLLHLDSFHTVKSKRKRKESVKSRLDEESRWRPGHQGQGTRGARGTYLSQYNSNDAGGWRNASVRKENGVEEIRGKTFRHPPVLKESDTVQRRHSEKSSCISSNGLVKVPNGSLTRDHDSKPHLVVDAYNSQGNSRASADSSSQIRSKGSAEHAPSASDPVLVPTHNSRIPIAVGTIKCLLRTQKISAQANSNSLADVGRGNTVSISNGHLKQSEPQIAVESEVLSSVNQREASKLENVAQPKISYDGALAVENHAPNNDSVVKPFSPQGMEEAALKLEKLKVSDGQHVIIPTHIQVPDAVKGVLSFGSLGSFGVMEKDVNGESVKNLNIVADAASNEANGNPSSCDEDAVSSAPLVAHAVCPHSPSRLSDNISPAYTKAFSFAPVLKDNHPEEESLLAVGPQFQVVQTTPSYNFGFMPPMLANTLVQHGGLLSQAHVSNSQSCSPPAVSTPSSTPPPTQSAGSGQSSVPLSPQPIPLFNHPYPPNYVPYNHYFPFYVAHTMHPYYGHTGFPASLPTGFLPSPTAAAGMKISAAHCKPGTNAGNQVPAGYGMYNSSQAGYSSNAGVPYENLSAIEDHVPSVLKDNVYPRQQSEGSTVLFPAAGRDTASVPLNSFLNIPPQGQNVISAQSGLGPFAFYHTLQPMPTPVPGLPLLQQSQPVTGPIESVGPPASAYQQSQRQQQTNWNT